MFEAVILLALLGVILLYIVTGERSHATRRASFIDLSAELKPSTDKRSKRVQLKKRP